MSLTQVQTKIQVRTEPLSKRQRLKAPQKLTEAEVRRQSKIFRPYRTIGLVSPTSVPFTAVSLGKTTFQITTSTGKSLQTYDLRKGLNLTFISKPSTPEVITAITAWKGVLLAAWGNEDSHSYGVWIFKRGRKIGELETPPQLNQKILSLDVYGSWIIGGSSKGLHVWKSASSVFHTTLSSGEVSKNNNAIRYTGCACSMQTYVNKLFVGRQDGSVEIWNVSTGKHLYTIYAPSSEHGAVTALEPTTSLSLLAIGYASGRVVIHDVRRDRKMLTLNKEGQLKKPVTSISFRSDGLGAGLDGKEVGVVATTFEDSNDVIFWDLSSGARKMGVLRNAHRSGQMQQHPRDPRGVNKVEFLAGQAILVTTGSDNALRTWVFDETPSSPIPRILHSRSGHAAPVSTLQFLPPDADGSEANGKWLMSGSFDQSFWAWSLRRDGQSTEISQGHVQKKAKKLGLFSSDGNENDNPYETLKAPPVTCMACSLNRDGGIGAMPGKQNIWGNSKGKKPGKVAETSLTGWESIITGHRGDKAARTWFWGRKRAGRWAFETSDGSPVASVAITQCGTFALVGSSMGNIDMFNLQSGYHRQRYPAKLTPAQAKMRKMVETENRNLSRYGRNSDSLLSVHNNTENDRAIMGLAVDSLNRTVICSTYKGTLKFYKFATGMLDVKIDWRTKTKILGLRYHHLNDLIALACDDCCIRIVDIETRKLIRELHGCKGTILDWCFSNDGRWIIATSIDSVIRTWDLPTGHLIDAARFRHRCTSLAFSNTGDFLATAHENIKGIHLWSNRSLFTHIPTRRLLENDIAEIDAPTPSGESRQDIVGLPNDDDDEEDNAIGKDEEFGASDSSAPTVDQLSSDLQTLSLVPKSRWQTLLHLDLIKQRNKPTEPPKQPEKAPFFLPSLQSDQNKDTADRSETRLLSTNRSTDLSSSSRSSQNENGVVHNRRLVNRPQPISTILNSSTTGGGPGEIRSRSLSLIDYLKALPPSSADLAIRSINTRPPYTEVIAFLNALVESLRTRRNYELVQAWMAVFLRLHGSVINTDERVMDAVRRWKDIEMKERARLNELVGFCSGVLGFVREGRS